MMETNTTAIGKANDHISMINPEILFTATEADFLEWKFYDASEYESVFNFIPPIVVPRDPEIKRLKIKRGQAAWIF